MKPHPSYLILVEPMPQPKCNCCPKGMFRIAARATTKTGTSADCFVELDLAPTREDAIMAARDANARFEWHAPAKEFV